MAGFQCPECFGETFRVRRSGPTNKPFGINLICTECNHHFYR